jgi:two-component system cell cycle response regulator
LGSVNGLEVLYVRHMSDDERTTNPHRTVITAADLPPQAPKHQDACLVVIYGDDLGRRIPLTRRPTVIGRSSKADVQVDQESVSRNHCRLLYHKDAYVLQDMGSTNGSYVNDTLVDTIVLRDGDQLKVGRTILKFIVGGNVEAQYHEEIYRLMTVDGLTQVHNKRFFDEALEREVSRCTRYGRTFALVTFDIDHFKGVNDTHGHLAGDAVLRQLGVLVRDHVRRDDIVCRTGGEEFAILAPELDGAHGLIFAEKLRTLVETTRFEFEGTRLPVTVSLGVAEWSSTMQSGDDLVRSADMKLYDAKRTGRNRVVG